MRRRLVAFALVLLCYRPWCFAQTEKRIANTPRHSPGAVSNLAICSADEKLTAILILFFPLRALYLHPVAFARYVRRVSSLGHDALEPALAAFSEQLLAVLERLGVAHVRVIMPTQ